MQDITRVNAKVLKPGGTTLADSLPARIHRGIGMSVESQLSLGIEPALRLSWRIERAYWSDGFTLMIFRSLTGFSPEKYPDDLNRHGQLIIETTQDDSYHTRPEEGTHYYTLLLHKRGFLGLSEKMALVRFSESVPSAKVGIGRIKDQIELQSMLRRHDLENIEYEAKLYEAELRVIRSRKNLEEAKNSTSRKASGGNEILNSEMAAIDAILETFIAKREKLQSLKTDPKFKKLTPTERKKVIEEVEQRLSAAEVSARQAMRGS